MKTFKLSSKGLILMSPTRAYYRGASGERGTGCLSGGAMRRHDEVKDEVAARVKKHVHDNGLGFIPLHSAHYSKAFRRFSWAVPSTCAVD